MRIPSHCSNTMPTRIATPRNRTALPWTKPNIRDELGNGYRQISEDRAVHQPVGPSNSKSRCIAESAACISIKTSSFWQHDPQLSQTTRAEQGVYPSSNPEKKNRRRRVELLRDQTRVSEEYLRRSCRRRLLRGRNRGLERVGVDRIFRMP